MPAYNPHEIEPKWQKYWEERKTFRALDDARKPKLYVLDMFPYPSGEGLHVGHLMLLLQFGNMPRDKAMKNIRLFAEKVMPHLRGVWSDWEDEWWVHPLGKSDRAMPGRSPAAAVLW